MNPTPAEEVPSPAQPQTSRATAPGTFQQMPTMPNGPTRTSRYPRNMQRSYQYQQQPRMSRRPPPRRPQYSDVVPTGYQDSQVFYDDDQADTRRPRLAATTPTGTGTANYRR